MAFLVIYEIYSPLNRMLVTGTPCYFHSGEGIGPYFSSLLLSIPRQTGALPSIGAFIFTSQSIGSYPNEMSQNASDSKDLLLLPCPYFPVPHLLNWELHAGFNYSSAGFVYLCFVSFYCLLLFWRAFFQSEYKFSEDIHWTSVFFRVEHRPRQTAGAPSSVAESNGVKQTPTFLVHLPPSWAWWLRPECSKIVLSGDF